MPDGPRETDIHMTDGVISGVREGRPIPAGAKVIDATGLYVLPGAIDVHVHSRDPGFPDKEDFGTLTAAAAAGGVTTVIDMPNTVPAVDSAGALESKAALARSRSRVDFGLWALIRFTSTPEQLAELAFAGATGFKAYLGYSFSLSRKQVMHSIAPDDPDLEPPPDYGTLTRLAPAVADLGLPLLVHAEDAGVLHAWNRANLLQQPGHEVSRARVIAVARAGQRDSRGQHVLRPESGPDGQQPQEAQRQ